MWPFRPKPSRPEIPPYKPVEVHPPVKEPESVEVTEIDTKDMTATGIHKIWNRWKEKT